MVFCNSHTQDSTCRKKKSHNPYFNRWFSAICSLNDIDTQKIVTILILIDGFLQLCIDVFKHRLKSCHNPYFNRWFSAIRI